MNAEPVKLAQSDAPVTEPSGWMNTNGDFGDGVPENIKTLLDAKKWTNVEQVVTGFTELEKYKGIASGKHIVLPEDMNDSNAMSEVFNAIGRPESADKYEFKNETGVEISDELMTSFKQFAHNEGYSQKQLSGAIQFQLEAIKASDEIFTQQRKERRDGHIETMQQKWQDKYETTQTKIDAAAEKLQVKSFFEEMGIDKEPEVINMLLTIANSDSEGSIGPDGTPAPVAKGLQEQLQELMKSEAFNQRFHQDHKKVVAEYMELNQKIANAGQGRAPRN